MLKQIVAKRLDKQAEDAPHQLEEKNFVLEQPEQGNTVIDEVKEIISLPRYRARTDVMGEEESVLLPEIVVQELHDYVTTTAAMYNPNDFHNFEHASHVTMSATKLVSRIVAPSGIQLETSWAESVKALHDHT
jgi:hypothetical protein